MSPTAARADIYGLGCVLFEMLAGETPFADASAHASITKLLTEAPQPISTIAQQIPEGTGEPLDESSHLPPRFFDGPC